MDAQAQFQKDPDATLDYTWDWTEWLVGADTITNAVVLLSPGLTLVSSNFSTTAVTAWIAGGSPGLPYSATARVTTTGGRIDDRTIVVQVLNR